MARGYFAVRLTGLREQGIFDSYFEMYEAVATQLEVIDGFHLHAPHRVSNPDAVVSDELSARDTYLLDRLQVTHSDVVIACLELASFGVGAELQTAADFGIPVVAFYYSQATRGPSRLVLGMPNLQGRDVDGRYLAYPPTPEGRSALLGALRSSVATALEHKPPRADRPLGIARMLDHRRRALGMTCDDLAKAAGLAGGSIRLLSLAGDEFLQWLQSPPIRRAVTLPIADIHEDRVLLPSIDVVLRIALQLRLPASDLFAFQQEPAARDTPNLHRTDRETRD